MGEVQCGLSRVQPLYIASANSHKSVLHEVAVLEIGKLAGEQHFHCALYDKSFSVSGNLKTHMRLHNGDNFFLQPM
jgi:hypothetical protein